MSREVMTQALDAMEALESYGLFYFHSRDAPMHLKKAREAINALRVALENPTITDSGGWPPHSQEAEHHASFQAWARSNGLDLTPAARPYHYDDPNTEDLWMAWFPRM